MPTALPIRLLLSATVLSCLAASAQTTPAPAPDPTLQIQLPPDTEQRIDQPLDQHITTLHANARAVLLDVIVTDTHGRPVSGLTPQAFQVYEDGKLQSILSLEEHHPPTPEELAQVHKPRPLPPNTFANIHPAALPNATTTVFLLDALDSPLEAQIIARDELLKWVNSMQPGNQVAVFQLNGTLKLIQGFTTDPEVLKAAIKNRTKTSFALAPQGGGITTALGQMASITNAMQTLGAYLQSIPGRKDLIWFTGHVPRTTYDDGSPIGGSLHDGQSLLFDYSKATDALVLGQVSIYPIDTRTLAPLAPGGGVVSTVGNSITGTRVQPHDAMQNLTRTQFFEHTDLDQVADATGGRAFYDTNGIKEAVSQVVATGQSYYTLSYYPTNKNWDGAFRKLRIDPAPSNLQLEYRRGYYAQADVGPRPDPVSPTDLPVALELPGRIQLTHHDVGLAEAAFATSMSLGGVDLSQLIFAGRVDMNPTVLKFSRTQPLPRDNFLEAQFRDRPFRNMQVYYTIPASQLALKPGPDGLRHGSVELVTLVFDDKGVRVNSCTNQIDMRLNAATYKALLAKGLQMPVTIAVPEKGAYFLKLGVHDMTSGKAGSLEIPTAEIHPTAKTVSARP